MCNIVNWSYQYHSELSYNRILKYSDREARANRVDKIRRRVLRRLMGLHCLPLYQFIRHVNTKSTDVNT